MKTSNEKITNKELARMCFNQGALGMEYSWNYPRQMHMAFLLMIDKFLKRIYKDNPEGYAAALTRHMAFFTISTIRWWNCIIYGRTSSCW